MDLKKDLIYKARIGLLEITLLLISIFAFTSLISEINLVSAETITKQDSQGKPIEVSLQSDGTWLNQKTGVIYSEGTDGRLYSLSQPSSKDPISSTQVPANAPTGIASPTVFPQTSNSPFAASQGVASPQATTGGEGVSALAANMGQMGSLIQGPIGEAFMWGGVMFGAGMAVSSVMGANERQIEAISIAAGVGAFSAKIIQGYLGTGPIATIGIGIGIGLFTYWLLYEDIKYEAVTFQCMPWQAPIGATSSICEICNEEGKPCSEYRCKSLGQTCELVNAGTSQEMCINVNPKDVGPPRITPNDQELTLGYRYTEKTEFPPGPGIQIVKQDSDNPCIEAFSPLRFGINTSEPSQCKIDFNSTTSFDAMFSYMGRSNLFKYVHYEQLVLPYAQDMTNSSLQLRNGQDLTLYIRCQDKLGNTNEAEYSVSFCVDPSPDTTPPMIKLTSIENEGCIPATTDSAMVEFYVNEPSQCKWSRDDQAYELMKGNMVCADKLFQMNSMQLYTCRANLTGITRDLTDFYVRCQDQQNKPINDRNTNEESVRFSLRGSNQLKLNAILPNETILGGISPLPVDLEVRTLFGCENGKANCYFSHNGIEGDYILFAETNNVEGIHTQRLYLPGGEHEYFVKCVDSGGNLIVDSTKFFLDIDTSSPIIARIYNDKGQLKIVTLRDSECSYSFNNCDFLFEEGMNMPKDDSKVHFAEWNHEKTYYVKCRDKYRDLTADCSAIIKPMKFFHEE
jgi:hypothetical protein